METYDEYELSFDAFTPETIPMERLAQYMSAFAKLLGNAPYVHFAKLEKGSTRQFAHVELEAANKVAQRLAFINGLEAANDAAAAFNEVNVLLKEDNAIGQLFRRAAGTDRRSTVLTFKGREIPTPPVFGPFNEPIVVDGELVRIGGKDQTAHAAIVDSEGRQWSGEVSRALAKELAPYLYQGAILRLKGEARWKRLEDGTWSYTSLKYQAFEVLADEGLIDAVRGLRSLEDSGWSELNDMDGVLRSERTDRDGIH